MKKEDVLVRDLTEMYRETKDNKLHWTLSVKTTENNIASKKPKETEDGEEWTVDECYTAFDCSRKGNDFHMITYEMIKTSGEKVKTINFVFLPDEGVRYFDLHTLMPHSIEASAPLVSQIHNLYELLMEMHQQNPDSVNLSVSEGTLTIDD
jgi:hypothetical protein